MPRLPLVIPPSSANVELKTTDGWHTHGCVTNLEEMYLLLLPMVLASSTSNIKGGVDSLVAKVSI